MVILIKKSLTISQTKLDWRIIWIHLVFVISIALIKLTKILYKTNALYFENITISITLSSQTFGIYNIFFENSIIKIYVYILEKFWFHKDYYLYIERHGIWFMFIIIY